MLSNLPYFKDCLEIGFAYREKNPEYAHFCSWQGRAVCLGIGGIAAVGIILWPPLAVCYACTTTASFIWKVLDCTMCLLFTPFLAVVVLIKGLFGATLHPGILFKFP